MSICPWGSKTQYETIAVCRFALTNARFAIRSFSHFEVFVRFNDLDLVGSSKVF